MRILYLLFSLLFLALQVSPDTPIACRFRRGFCKYGGCRPPYYQAGSCGGLRSSCCGSLWS
uniref:Beta-defensin-like domain-containing protein n=1 Tax=Meleagris gallopavo TaxID=9103 RepID=G1NN32_MELGA